MTPMRGLRLRTLEKYLGKQIYGATGFILFAFLALFAFFDLIKELTDLDKRQYQLRHRLASRSFTHPAQHVGFGGTV